MGLSVPLLSFLNLVSNKTYWFDRGEVRGTHKLIALKEQFDIYIFWNGGYTRPDG